MHARLFSVSLLCVSAIVLGGCQTTRTVEPDLVDGKEVYQFDPIPVPVIGAQDLSISAPEDPTKLLDEALVAFELANKAQEEGDTDVAFQQYTQMMELLLESDLDPSVFYSLRNEFNQILGESTRLAKLNNTTTTPPPVVDEAEVLAIRSELDYPNPLNDRVLAEIYHIQKSYPKGFQAGLNRSARYLPHIRAEFKKAGLPEDLVWLAMVESQFTPRINSRVGAGGMWQFMPSTGSRFNLQRDHYIDERYDWKKSTQASIQYLSKLYEMFDSWPLAVSSYNVGEGAIERAIALNGGQRDLWGLLDTGAASKRIPRETKKFYPKLLASALIANNPEKYGFTPSTEAAEQTETVKVSSAYMLEDIEKAAGIASGTLGKLNTHFRYNYSPPNRTANLYVPVGTAARVRSALPKLSQLRPDTHVVRRGETLSGIASMYQTTANELMRINNIKSARRLQVSQRLVIPGRLGSRGGASATVSGNRKVYVVRKGDSLSGIASRYGTTISKLQQWNVMGRNTRIHVGDRIYVSKPSSNTISSKSSTSSAGTGTLVIYTVRSGDTLGKIATKQGVSLKNLLMWNKLTNRSTIRPGDKLKLYKGRATSSSAGATKTHTVKRGENPGTISKKYGIRTSDLLRWNNLKSSSIVHVGDVLHVQNPGTSGTTITHTVKRGENPGSIARKYKVSTQSFYAANGWTKNPVLQIGQKVKIPQ